MIRGARFSLWLAAFGAGAGALHVMARRLAAALGWTLSKAWLATAVSLATLWVMLRLLGLDERSRRRRRLLGYSTADLDRLDGPSFEDWVLAVLEARGWQVQTTTRGGDYGVDLIASQGGVRIGIEVKRRQGKIANSVVRSVVAGCQYHGCQVAAVVTQSRFTAQAQRQAAAAALPVVLVGREEVSQLPEMLATVAEGVAASSHEP